MNEPTRNPQVGVVAAEKQRIGKVVDIEGPECTEPEAERLDTPARLLCGTPPELLDQDEAEDRQRELAEQCVATRVAGQQKPA